MSLVGRYGRHLASIHLFDVGACHLLSLGHTASSKQPRGSDPSILGSPVIMRSQQSMQWNEFDQSINDVESRDKQPNTVSLHRLNLIMSYSRHIVVYTTLSTTRYFLHCCNSHTFFLPFFQSLFLGQCSLCNHKFQSSRRARTNRNSLSDLDSTMNPRVRRTSTQ